MDRIFKMITTSAIFLFRYIWVVILLVFIGYFVYQTSFSWKENIESFSKGTLDNNEEVVFVVIEENYSGIKKSGFDSLSDSLKTWEFNKREKKVYLKYEKLLPYTIIGKGNDAEKVYNRTKVIVLYDRGFDSFERYSDVLSISSFPYEYYFKGEPLITIHGIDANGTVFLEFKGKQVQLSKDENYPNVSVKGFQLVKTDIKNYGIYKKNQFVPFKEDMGEKKKGNKKTEENKEQTENESENDAPPKKPLSNIHS